MNRCVTASVLAVLWLGACNPTPAPASYFQPMTTETQDSTSYLLPMTPAADHGRANQAADGERLASIQGNVNFVKYRMLDRYSAFMMSGDVSTGTPFGGATFETLQLPASSPPDASGERPERTVNLMELHPEKRTSFRVYNRGACSSMEDWQTVAQGFGDALADQLQEDSRVTDPVVTGGSLNVVLRSEFPNAIGAPDDRDELYVATHMHIDRITGAHGTNCPDVNMDIGFAVALEHTEKMQLQIARGVFALGCRLADELDAYAALASGYVACAVPDSYSKQWLDPGAVGSFVGNIGGCAGFGEPSTALQYAASQLHAAYTREAVRIQDDLDAGVPVVCDTNACLGTEFSDAGWSVRTRRSLSGARRDQDPWLLFGLERMAGQDLGAHDTLGRVLSVRVANMTRNGGTCGPYRRTVIMTTIRNQLRVGLPMALNAAFMAGAVQDPGLAEADTQRWRVCDTDADCDFRAPGGPAFQTVPRRGYPAVWRGARHVCRPSPDADVCLAHGTNANCSFCAAQLEIDRINVRPDGLEVVIEDDVDLDVDPQDPQASFEVFSPFVRSLLCSPVRRGIPPPGGYRDWRLEPFPQNWGDFSFPIAATSGVGGATVPVLTDGP